MCIFVQRKQNVKQLERAVGKVINLTELNVNLEIFCKSKKQIVVDCLERRGKTINFKPKHLKLLHLSVEDKNVFFDVTWSMV